VILVAAGCLLVLGSVLYARSRYNALHSHVNQRAADVSTISPWMTLPYVSRAYNVPEPVLLNALGMNRLQARRHTLAGIAALRHSTTQAIIATVRAAILQYRAHPPSTPVAAPSMPPPGAGR
jgi:hypothetical protein